MSEAAPTHNHHMNNLSLLDQAFQDAFCTDPVKPGDTATCECGISHKSTEEHKLRTGRGPGGYFLVSGCTCQYTSSFAGMFWQYRHEIARFFERMMTAMAEDKSRLIAVLPTDAEL